MPRGIYPRSEEHNRKISEANKGKQVSEETRQKLSRARRGKHLNLSEETRKRLSELSRKRWQNPECAKRMAARGIPKKNGKTIDKKGYIRILVPPSSPFYPMADHESYVPEHRLIIAQHLGRLLKRYEVVHHKNGIKNDNRLENLELVNSNGEHIHQKHPDNSLLVQQMYRLEQEVQRLEQENTKLRTELEKLTAKK
jgi:hypothetical protein